MNVSSLQTPSAVQIRLKSLGDLSSFPPPSVGTAAVDWNVGFQDSPGRLRGAGVAVSVSCHLLQSLVARGGLPKPLGRGPPRALCGILLSPGAPVLRCSGGLLIDTWVVSDSSLPVNTAAHIPDYGHRDVRSFISYLKAEFVMSPTKHKP